MTAAPRMLITKPMAQSGVSPETEGLLDRDQRHLSPRLGRRATRVMAQSRLNSELRSIALDILGPCDADILPDKLAEWVEGAADAAASAVCERSMAALTHELEAAIARAPRGVVGQLNAAALRRDAGQI